MSALRNGSDSSKDSQSSFPIRKPIGNSATRSCRKSSRQSHGRLPRFSLHPGCADRGCGELTDVYIASGGTLVTCIWLSSRASRSLVGAKGVLDRQVLTYSFRNDGTNTCPRSAIRSTTTRRHFDSGSATLLRLCPMFGTMQRTSTMHEWPGAQLGDTTNSVSIYRGLLGITCTCPSPKTP